MNCEHCEFNVCKRCKPDFYADLTGVNGCEADCGVGKFGNPITAFCERCPAGCTDCDANACTDCATSYELDNGVCRGCDGNCHRCADGVCFECKAGLILDDRAQCV